jgi:hypothetical protein
VNRRFRPAWDGSIPLVTGCSSLCNIVVMEVRYYGSRCKIATCALEASWVASQQFASSHHRM